MSNELTPRQAQILEMLRNNPRGWTTPVLAKRIGLSQSRTAEVLRLLRDQGLAAVTAHGSGALWSTPERCKVLRELAASRRRKLRRAREKDRKEQALALAWLEPVHRCLPAHEAVPIRPRAPASVFHLAAA